MPKEVRSIPFLTEGAISFLEEMCSSQDISVLEFGAGGTTLWFEQRVKQLISIDHTPAWVEAVSAKLKTSHSILHIERSYHHICSTFPEQSFDLVLIDGRDRVLCALASIPLIKPGGYLMLDNSERDEYHSLYVILSDWRLTESEQTSPDSTGFWYPGWKTSWWKKPKDLK